MSAQSRVSGIAVHVNSGPSTPEIANVAANSVRAAVMQRGDMRGAVRKATRTYFS